MSNLNFLHSGGNKVTISAPASNPTSNVTFKLPQEDGSAQQGFADGWKWKFKLGYNTNSHTRNNHDGSVETC